MKQHITFSLHQTVCLMDALADTILKERFNISYRRFYFLLKLAILPQPTQHELTELLGYSDAAVSRMAGQLQEIGLLSVTQDPHHARRNRLTLTAAGADLVQKATTTLVAEFDVLMQMNHIELEQYEATTRRIQQILESKTKGGE